MHYSVYVFIPPDGDLEEEVAKRLRLYDEDHEVPPYKEYLDTGEIAAMALHYGCRRSERQALAKHMESWRGCPGGTDAEGLFAVKTVNPHGKWDWYEVGGRWGHRFPGHVIGAKALLQKAHLTELLPYAFVTPNGLWYERETFIVEGWMRWKTVRKRDGAWLREMTSALKAHPESRIVCVDCHR